MALKLLDDGSPVPLGDAVVGKDGRLTPIWQEYLGRLPATLAAIPAIVNVVKIGSNIASLSATDAAGQILKPGVYRLSYWTRITRAATTSSSLTVTLRWPSGTGVAVAYTGAAITANVTTAYQQDVIFFRTAGGDSTVTYETAYASVGAVSMAYRLDLCLERISLL